MCGKFTSMATWSQVVAFSQPLTAERFEAKDDHEVTFRVMSNLPLLIFDPDTRERRIIAARWGYPHPKDWRRPQPIHARSESIETTKAFARSFLDGQRGIVLCKTFNEAPDVPGPALQHTITPDTDKSGLAFIWRAFDVGAALPMVACVMVTVPANRLIATLPTDRMPAILDPADWAKWIGEEPATVDELKAMLKTIEGVKWTMRREERAEKAKRLNPTISDPGGLG
jgi:putative SOS response-associated peptidase YedK